MELRSALLSIWQTNDGASGVGNIGLFDHPLTAFFASRKCSGAAIRAAMDWAVEQARGRTPIISGFHSPLEQSVLKVLLAADASVVIVISRNLHGARFPSAWQRALQNGTAAIVSISNSKQRLTGAMIGLRSTRTTLSWRMHQARDG